MDFKKNYGLFFILICLSFHLSAGELAEREAIKNNVKQLFLSGEYDTLDELERQYRETEARTDSGLWKLTFFYFGIEELPLTDYVKIIEGMDKWIQNSPKSPAAIISKATFSQNFLTLKHIQDSIEYEVNFSEKIKKLKKVLKFLEEPEQLMFKHKKMASVDPYWYMVMAEIDYKIRMTLKTSIAPTIGLQRKNKRIIERPTDHIKLSPFITLLPHTLMLRKGIQRFPHYYQYYFSLLRFVPSNRSVVDNIASYAIQKTKNKIGQTMAARVFWYAKTFHHINFAAEIEYNSSYWKRMNKGIYDLIDDYPAQWNIQQLAYFACGENDQKMTKFLFNRMSDKLIPVVWGTDKAYTYYKHCKGLANLNEKIAFKMAENFEQFHQFIAKTYAPQKPENEAFNTQQADLLWKEIRENIPKYTPWVRRELKQPKTPNMFLLFGGDFLYTYTDDPDDLQLELDSELKYQPKTQAEYDEYFGRIEDHIYKDIDATDLILHILDFDKFFIIRRDSDSKQKMFFDQSLSILVLLFKTPEIDFLEPLIQRLEGKNSLTAQRSILFLLYLTISDKGDKAIQKYINDDSNPAELRKFGKALLNAKIEEPKIKNRVEKEEDRLIKKDPTSIYAQHRRIDRAKKRLAKEDRLQLPAEELKAERRAVLKWIDKKTLNKFFEITKELLKQKQLKEKK